MPTYTYACTDCDEQLEVVQSFTADPLTDCPRCGGRLRKVFHPVGVVFKGSGFYRTDSRSGTKDTSAGSGSSAADGSGSTDTKGSSSGGSDSGSDAQTGKTTKAPTTSAAKSTSPSTGTSGSGTSGGTTPS